MTGNKRFELYVNQNNQYDIVDGVESKEKKAICIYNDLGHYYFSSAKALCELLNELHDENQSSKEFIEQLQEELVLFKEAGANMGIDLNAQITALKQENEKLKNKLKFFNELNKPYGDIIKENEQLKQQNKMLRTNVGKLTDDVKYLRNLPSTHQKENEQLKQFKEDVFNTIDMHLRMLPTARDNEFNEDDGDPSLYTGAIYMLETLKKELLE